MLRPALALGRRLVTALALGSLAIGLLPARPAAANTPPNTPVIESPAAVDVAPSDVHMELGAPFRDADGDAHQATDWEIRKDDGSEVVWAAYDSPQLVHAHFSDGRFMNSMAGKDSLRFRTDYLFRVRFRDSQGAWSAWAERPFTTSTDSEVPPRQVRGILARPAPTWRGDGDTPIALPAGGRLVLEAAAGDAPLLTLAAGDTGLEATPGAFLAAPDTLRLRLIAPAEAGLSLPASRLSAVSDQAERLIISLPAVQLAAGQAQLLWVSRTGATFYAEENQAHSGRDRLARDTGLPWTLPAGYRLEAVGAAFQLPTSLAFVADPGADPEAPRSYLTELYGRVKVVTNGGRVLTFADDLLDLDPTGLFPGSGEMGVIGVCLPPTGRDVYATMISSDGTNLRNKVVRLRSADGLRATAIEDVLVTEPGEGLARSSHQIQQCSFGPDGKLYVFVADGPDPAAAQDDATFNGKVLRLNPDGSAPSDNPFYDPANPTAPISYQYTKGHRNAFGMAWRQADGRLYLAENGANVDRIARITPGLNYGWHGSDDNMRTNALYVWPNAHWAPVGLAFADGPAAGALAPGQRDHLFVGTAGAVYAAGPQSTGKAIQEFVVDADGTISQEPTIFARYEGEGRGSIADVKVQPDGLYFTDLYQDDGDGGAAAPGGKLWRIRYTGQVDFTTSTRAGPAPLTVAFADTSTLVGAGAPAWDFGDGATAADAAPTHTFTAPGRYLVTLTRAGADGQPAESLALITVTDAAGAIPDAGPQPVAAPPAPATLTFPETGATLGGGFKLFWERNGGLTAFGYPITREFQERNPDDGRTYTVQYFERARFEYHPENKGTPYEVQLGLLGRQAAAGRTAEAAFQPAGTGGSSDGSVLAFAETGHTLSGAFRARWETTGGAAIYGLPISEAFTEPTTEDAPPVLVQYFERARMEYRPEFAGTIREVTLRRLGTAAAAALPDRR